MLFGEEVGWLFFGGTVSFGGERTKVRGLNLMMTWFFLRKPTVASLFDPTRLALVVGTPHHGPKA